MSEAAHIKSHQYDCLNIKTGKEEQQACQWEAESPRIFNIYKEL